MESPAPGEWKGFRDRTDAGRQLAGRLGAYAGREDVTVLGLPRGGVPVAAEVARALGAPLDVVVVRKLGVPGHEELAMGALAGGGVRVLNDEVVRTLHVPAHALAAATAQAAVALDEQERRFRGGRPPPALEGRTVILVDDGLATGSTMRAAAEAVARHRPARTVVAVPVAARETCVELAREADEVVAVATPEPFYAVGVWYADFAPTADDEVLALLDAGRAPASAP